MARLDKSIDDINKIVARRVQESTLAGRKKIREWKGRKLYNASRWRKMVSSCDDPMDVLDYIPNSFVEYPFTGHNGNLPPESAIDEWFDAYHEYLRFVKDSKFGRDGCDRCILNPKVSFKPSFYRDLVIKALKQEMNPKFPCTVVNIFKCPYGEKNGILFDTGLAWEIFYEALRHARLVTEEFDGIYHVDYNKGHAGDSPHYMYRKIEDVLGMIIFPIVQVRTRKDIYEIITSRKRLGSFIDQYIDSMEKKTLRIYKMQVGDSRFKHEWIKKHRNQIVDLLLETKKSLKIEMMGDLYAEGLIENENSEEAVKSSGTCVLCDKAARIHCVNCDSWICLDHWSEHGIKVHNYIPTEK